MGAFFTQLWWGGDPDIIDETSGLSKRDVHNVKTSWAIVNKDPIGNGTELFRRLFKTFPETKTFFIMLDGVNESEYHNNYQFKAHVIKLMSSLSLVFDNLHQPQVAIAMLDRLGESHNKRKIKKKHFHQLKEVLVKMLIEVLGLSEDKLISWDRTVTFMYYHIFKCLEYDR